MKSPDTPIKLIVGLGNPGNEYAQTRHNAGQMLVEQLAAANAARLSADAKFFGLSTRIQLNGEDIRLLVPVTFMNLSGKSVAALAQFFKIENKEILVVHDELDLDPGVARLKIGGGHGGHNGLRDIIRALGNDKGFARLRIGIGHPGHANQVSNYVLKKAPLGEQDRIEEAIHTALPFMHNLAKGEWEKAMRELHSKNQTQTKPN